VDVYFLSEHISLHSAFGVSWMELLSCVVHRERYHGGFIHGGFVWAFYYGTYHNRYANRDFSRKRGLKEDYFYKDIF
jgi:hypothetical protein